MKEIYRDTGLVEGSHGGGNAASALVDLSGNVDFVITYAIGRLLENTTQDTSGVVTAQTENTLTASGVTWDLNDTYILYVGATKNAVISRTEVCRQSAFAYPEWELGERGIHPDHEDKDEREMRPGTGVRPTKLRR